MGRSKNVAASETPFGWIVEGQQKKEQENAEPERCLLMVSEGDEKQEEEMMGANERVAVESEDDEEWIENRAHDETENHVRQAMDKKIESVIKRKMRCVWSAPGQRSESREEVSQYSFIF